MCQSCNDLYNIAPNLWNTGITSAVCTNLRNNTGVTTNTSRNNCTDLGLMADCLGNRYIGRLAAADPCHWEDFLGDLLKDFTIYNNAIVCNECGQWTNINELWIEINKIWEAIRQISTGGIYEELQFGVDFQAVMYNGFWANDATQGELVRSPIQSPIVEYYNLDNYYYMRFRFNATTRVLRNDDLIGNDVYILHSLSPADYPKSWIYRVWFINDYAFLNNYTAYINSTGASTGIWNINPASARARWQATCGLSRNVVGAGQGLTSTITSYADGYNNQFSVYSPTIDGVRTSGLNLANTFTLVT